MIKVLLTTLSLLMISCASQNNRVPATVSSESNNPDDKITTSTSFKDFSDHLSSLIPESAQICVFNTHQRIMDNYQTKAGAAAFAKTLRPGFIKPGLNNYIDLACDGKFISNISISYNSQNEMPVGFGLLSITSSIIKDFELTSVNNSQGKYRNHRTFIYTRR